MGLEKERAKLRAGQAPAEAKVKIVQRTIFVTRVRVVPLCAPWTFLFLLIEQNDSIRKFLISFLENTIDYEILFDIIKISVYNKYRNWITAENAVTTTYSYNNTFAIW